MNQDLHPKLGGGSYAVEVLTETELKHCLGLRQIEERDRGIV